MRNIKNYHFKLLKNKYTKTLNLTNALHLKNMSNISYKTAVRLDK